MKRDHARQFLEQGLAELQQARRHLDYSFQQVAGLPESAAICDRVAAHAGQILNQS